MADIWIRATRLVGVISIPALVGLVIVAPDFVQVVLGSKWSDATTVIQILAVVGIVQSLHTLNGEVLMALGKAGTLLRYTMLWTAGSLAAVVIGLQGDIVTVAVCLRSRDAADRAVARLGHDARARDPALEIRQLALRRRAGDGADGRRRSSSPGSGSSRQERRPGCRLVLLIVLGVSRLHPAVACGALRRSRRRSRAHSAAGSAARRRASNRWTPACSSSDSAFSSRKAARSSRSARPQSPKRWPNGHWRRRRHPPTMKSCSTKLHIAKNGPASCRSRRVSSRCSR